MFVTRGFDVDSAALINSVGFEAVALPKLPTPAFSTREAEPNRPAHADWAGVHWSVDAQETAVALRSHRCDWIIVDHYAFDAPWQQQVSDRLNSKIAVIDDLADRKLFCDLLIDHNFHPDHVSKYRDKLFGAPELLFGPNFALLGTTYRDAPRYEFSDRVRRIGLFMGGTDPGNWTEIALRACRNEIDFKGEIEVVVTSANSHLQCVSTLAALHEGTTVSINLPNLASFFARNDLHIGAGGGSTWERCCIGAPTVGVLCAENQLLSMPYLNDLGVIAMVGQPSQWQAVRSSDISQVVEQLILNPTARRRLSERSRILVDGMGAWRVARRLFEMGGKTL